MNHIWLSHENLLSRYFLTWGANLAVKKIKHIVWRETEAGFGSAALTNSLTCLDSRERGDLTVLLQDKLQGWPHVGPVQPGPGPRTIARLCWAHLAFLFSASDHSLSHILPCSARMFTEHRPLNCLWFHRAPSIKSRTVWKDLQDGVERTIPDSDTGPLPPFFFFFSLSPSFWGFSSPFEGFRQRPVGQVPTQRKQWRIAAMTPHQKWDNEPLFPTQTFNDFK